MRALWKQLKAEQSALDKKEAHMYSKAFQRMAQVSDTKQPKAAQVSKQAVVAKFKTHAVCTCHQGVVKAASGSAYIYSDDLLCL